MSTNGPARPSSRRSFLIASAADITAGATTAAVYAVPAIASQKADPVLALIEAERLAHEANERALDRGEGAGRLSPDPASAALLTHSRVTWSRSSRRATGRLLG